MSVLPCSRNGCYSAMCPTSIDGIGYICNSCISEFKQKYPWGKSNTWFMKKLRKFIQKKKKYSTEHKVLDVYDFINNVAQQQ